MARNYRFLAVVNPGYARKGSIDTEALNDDHLKPHHRAGARQLAAARFFASILGLNFNEQESDHFAPVRVNETLTLLFDQDTSFDSHHYAFHVSDAEFDRYF